jgi:hypothetical protein
MEDYVDQLHHRTLAEYILELQQIMLDTWETAADRKTHAQGHIQQHHLRHTRPVHQFQPGDLFFKRSIPQRHTLRSECFHGPSSLPQAARLIHRATRCDRPTLSGNVLMFHQRAYSSRAPQQDETRLLNPQQYETRLLNPQQCP